MTVEYRDRLGNDIKPTNHFVYSANGGRAAILKVGFVVELATREGSVFDLTANRWQMAPLPVLKCLTADRWGKDQTWGIQGKGGATSWNKEADPEQVGKVMTLGDLEKICLVPETALPIDLVMMFRKAYNHHRPRPPSQSELDMTAAIKRAFSDESHRVTGQLEVYGPGPGLPRG